jgi:ATP-dependent Clp protease ATP-binding subunit ClpC
MSVLRSHFRPEFINRIDEIIIFHSLSKEQIQAVVRLQLQRVKKTAESQDIELVFDEALVAHFAEDGYRPEYGARELRRQIRQQLETKLAKAMLKGEVKEGSRISCGYDASTGVVFSLEPEVADAEKPAKNTRLVSVRVKAGKKSKGV